MQHTLTLSILLPLVFPLAAGATTFVPVPLEDLIDEADAFVHGTYRGHEYGESETGRIVTEHTLEAIAVGGIAEAPGGGGLYRFLSPGGVRGEIGLHVPGSPKFKPGEEVVVLLGGAGESFYVANLAAGKFAVVERGGTKVLENSIFPAQKGLSGISLEAFYEDAREKFGDDFRLIARAPDSAAVTSKTKEGGGSPRKPDGQEGREASSVEELPEEGGGGWPSWPALLVFVAAVFVVYRWRKNRS